MNVQTFTVQRCFRNGFGWVVTIRGEQRLFPIDDEVPEGSAVTIKGNRAFKAVLK